MTQKANDTPTSDERPVWPPIGIPAGGLVCRKCGCRHLDVLYTRHKSGYILRIRACRHCGRRLTTREAAD